MRVVIDTSVLVSAVLLPRSLPREAFDAAVAKGQVLFSIDTVAELDEVLRRPKFNRYVSEEDRLEFLAAFARAAEQVDVTQAISACRDPKDDKFLEVAVGGSATHIISSDLDLLTLNPFRGIKVVTAREFLSR
jgi:putative PIN family toxin of toxin-antitoxin system